MGPTASGKTKLAIELTRVLPCEIISVDSAMVYRGMDIGTAKPTFGELKLTPHRLINLCDPVQPYSAGQFLKDAKQEITDIHQHHKIPLLVGGTMLYFHALQRGVAELPVADQTIRETIAKSAAEKGWPKLHQALTEIDPKSANRIHPNDSQRIARALEIYQLTGKPMSDFFEAQSSKTPPYKTINIIIEPSDRKILHQRIAQRFETMLANGFMDEVEHLYQRSDLYPDLPSMRTVGYRQAWSYLAGDYDFATMKDRAIISTRQLAKRQLTWLKPWSNAHRFDMEHPKLLDQIVALLLTKNDG